MEKRQIFWILVFLLAGLTTWLLVWKNHYTPCIGTLVVAIVSAWRTGFIDIPSPNGGDREE